MPAPDSLKSKTAELTITLPDGKKLTFPGPVTVEQVAASIGPGLASAALAGKISNSHQKDILVDTSFLINENSTLSIITDKTPEGLDVIRHACAHLMAQAVQALFPQAQVTIGPVIEDGFYYDFGFERPFTPEDLDKIEKKMHEIATQDLKVHRSILSREKAIELFQKKGEKFKVQIIQDIPGAESLSFYQQGDFIDLCRGPHVPSTGKLKVFKLTKVAGAYWRGDEKNPMLQRIYGTAWANKKDLDAYLLRIEEAEKRDHRKLGKKFDLFHLQEEAPGMIFWHPKGWTVYQIVLNHVRKIINQNGYQEVKTPQIVDRKLWEKSGHWGEFRKNMFTLVADEHDYAIKPMNCPCHIQIFNQGLKSYRDLPLRLAEFDGLHRNEPSGSLHGLLRLRGFAQDDAHIFCTEEQIQDEVEAFNELLHKVYTDFGFKEIIVKLATRPDPRIGSDEIWDKAEEALKVALDRSGLAWTLSPGEGAFYGPKIEYSCKDTMGRVWQCGTIQIDYAMPERLGASYIAEDSSRKIPVMIHRAMLGGIERFIGILIEQTAGSFPLWLAPVQVVVMNITDAQAEYAHTLAKNLQESGFRVQEDLRNEKIGFKIREHTMQRVPYLAVVGDREVANQTLSLRNREGADLGVMSLQELISKLSSEEKQRS